MLFRDIPNHERLRFLLDEKEHLIADGATATNLFELGLESGDPPELWNFDKPSLVIGNHEAMRDAGADILLTNSFGGNAHRMKLHGSQDRIFEINKEAALLARQVVSEADRPLLVAGCMGPTGEIVMSASEEAASISTLPHEDAIEAFKHQAISLQEGSADIIWIETMSSLAEVEAAILGARSTGLPIVCTMSFDTSGFTMMGLTPQDVAEYFSLDGIDVAAFGANCGGGFGDTVASIMEMHEASKNEVLVVKSNCGIPELVKGKVCYSGSDNDLRKYARLAKDAGARIIGGCCGFTPDHIRILKEELECYTPSPVNLSVIDAELGLSRSDLTQPLKRRTGKSRTKRRGMS